MLGFAVVLAITVASMGIAYLGFERVSTGVASYRNSVSEADLARNIDRELISYRALVRYYVVTGKEEDAQAALTAETSLKDAIDQSMRGTTKPAGLEQITRLAREFRIFTKIFAAAVIVMPSALPGERRPPYRHGRTCPPSLKLRRTNTAKPGEALAQPGPGHPRRFLMGQASRRRCPGQARA